MPRIHFSSPFTLKLATLSRFETKAGILVAPSKRSPRLPLRGLFDPPPAPGLCIKLDQVEFEIPTSGVRAPLVEVKMITVSSKTLRSFPSSLYVILRISYHTFDMSLLSQPHGTSSDGWQSCPLHHQVLSACPDRFCESRPPGNMSPLTSFSGCWQTVQIAMTQVLIMPHFLHVSLQGLFLSSTNHEGRECKSWQW